MGVASPWLISSEQRKQSFVLGDKPYFLEITLHTGALAVNSEADTTGRTHILSNQINLSSPPREKLIPCYIHGNRTHPFICGDKACQPMNELKPHAPNHSTDTLKALYGDLYIVWHALNYCTN